MFSRLFSNRISVVFVVLAGVLTGFTATDQLKQVPADEAVTANDYKRAESFLFQHTNPLEYYTVSAQTWLDDGRLVYRKSVKGGFKFVLADPAAREKTPAFNHERIASALAGLTGEEIESGNLPFRSFDFSDDGRSILFTADDIHYKCVLIAYRCEEINTGNGDGSFNGTLSPDGTKAAFYPRLQLMDSKHRNR